MAGPHPGVSRVHVQAPAGDDEAEPTFVYEADFHIGGHPGLHHFDGSQAQQARRASKRGPLPRPRVLGGDLISIVRSQSFIPCSACAEKKKSDSEGLVPLDAVDATPTRR